MRACIALTILCLVVGAYPTTEGEKAVAADAFVNSIGINVHLHYADTSYGNFAAVEKALKDLGVRHIRDGLVDTAWTPYYDRLNELGRAGIKSILITTPRESGELLVAYPGRIPESFEGYEAPNEYDLSGDKDWAGTLNSFVTRLYRAVRGNPKTAKFPVIGPSLTQAASFQKPTGTQTFFDYANLHNYFGGWNPGTRGWGASGYGSYEWNLNLARSAWPGKPIFTTETGYFNDVSKVNGVPDAVAGTYMPRLLLEQWMHGIQRTYIYELVDLGGGRTGGDASYGLLHSDFSPKPAFTAVRSLIGLLADPGPAFVAGNLDFALSGDLRDVEHLLLEKRDGTFFLAIWVERLGYDVNGRRELEAGRRRIVVTSRERSKMAVHRLGVEEPLQPSEAGVGIAQAVEIGDRVVILEIAR
jgi:hypothetical protein